MSLSINAEVKRLSPNEGLTQSYVNTLLIDNNGYLWLSTEGGLNRYDGYQVLPITGPNGELEETIIDTIYQDSEGQIWIASLLAGLFRYDPATDSYKQFLSKPTSEEQIINESVFSMLSIDKKTMWLGRGRDFAKLDIASGKITSIFVLPSEKDHALVRTLFHYNGFIFIGSSKGAYVYHIATEQIRALEHLPQGIEHAYQNNIKSFALAQNNQLLVGAVRGLYSVDISNLSTLFEHPDQAFNSKTLLPDLNIWSISYDQGHVDLATDKGLFKFDLTHYDLIKNTELNKSKYTLTDTSIIDMVQDKTGGRWLATKSDGAFYLPKKHYNFNNVNGSKLSGAGLSHSSIWSIKQYQDKVWLGTHNGLTEIDLATGKSNIYLKNYSIDSLTKEFSVFSIMPYKNQFWLLTNLGLLVFDPDTHKISHALTRDPDNQKKLVGRVHGAQLINGILYYAHAEYGIFSYDIDSQNLTKLGGEFAKFDPFMVYGFLPPISNEPDWPLFYSAGILYHVNPQTLSLKKIYTVPEQHENIAINVLSYIVDKNNILWLSLSNFGLIGLDATSFELVHTIDIEKNKLGTLLYDMVRDDNEMIWMSSHKGIWRLNPDTLHFQQFTSSQGVLSAEFNSNAVAKFNDGTIAYGGLKGFTYFDPEKNNYQKALIDRVNITRVSLMSRELMVDLKQPLNEIELNHDDIGLEVAFSAMAFSQQERIIYEYQLDSGKKTFTHNNNRVLFPKLSPGTYQLKVWAKDPFTGSYTPPATLKIKVNYPLWRAPYFMVLYAALIVALVAVWVIRRNKIQRILMAAHKESKESEARLKLALEGSESGVWDWQSSDVNIYQPRLVSELGYEDESVNLDDYLSHIHPQDRAMFRLEWLEFLATDKGYFNCTYRLRHKKGYWCWYKDFGKVVLWDQKVPQKVAGTYTNMTREMVYEEHARLYTAAFEQTRDWVFILDKNLYIRTSNKSLQQAFNFTREPRSSRSLKLGIARCHRIDYLRLIKKLKVNEHYSCEDIVTLANNEKRHVLVKISAIADSQQRLSSYVIILTDIHSQKLAENALYKVVNYNALTGLPTRTLFNEQVEQALNKANTQQTQVALMHINIKRFKYFNDSIGHDSANELIKVVAQRISHCLSDDISLAHLSAAEFVVLVENVAQEQVLTALCNELLATANKNINVNNQVVNVNLNIGVALYPDDAVYSDSLFKAANIALYHANLTTEGSYQFYKQQMNYELQHSLYLEREITKAYQTHAFCNHYQPIVSAANFKTVGFEVLLRWPDNTRVKTQEFSLVAEKMGLITKIMLQTLSRALGELKQWREINPQLYLSINLSALDFELENLVTEIETALIDAEVPASACVFEITESVLISSSTHALKSMQALKQLGCNLYMDDFGTGYASLTYLKQFPIDAIKIDRSFVQNIGIDLDDETIIKSTLGLAQSLNKQCIAEGIESTQQLQFLNALGCQYYQGYLFSRAMESSSVPKLIERDWQYLFNKA